MLKNGLLFVLFFSGFFLQAQTGARLKDSLIEKLHAIDSYNKKFKPVRAIKEGHRVLELSKASGLDSITAETYYALGTSYEYVHEFDDALENYKSALHYAKARNDSVFMVFIYNGLGNISALKDKDYEASNQYYTQALNISRKVQPNLSGTFITNLCWNFIEAKAPEKVEPYIPELKNYLKEAEPGNFTETVFSSNICHILGQYYSAMGYFNKAIPYFDKSIRIARKHDLWENLKNAYKFRSQSFAAQGKFEKAYEDIKQSYFYKEKYLDGKAKDQLAVQKKSNLLKENKKALQASERENVLLDKMAHNRKIGFFLMSFLVLILIVFLIIIYRKNQTNKRLITMLRTRHKELMKTRKKAEKATENKNQFISSISHEIRTPLHGVTGITALLLERDEISKENKRLLKSLKFSGDYLMSLINNVLLMTKIDNKKIKVNSKNVPLLLFVESLKNATQFLAKKNNCQVKFEVDENIPKYIHIDTALLSEILINLTENAIKFSKNSEVTVNFQLMTRQADKLKIRFKISDTGPGIPEDKKETIFKKFSQGPQQEGQMKGTGLGLSIVKELLEILDSQIHLDSELGKGSSFYFDLNCGFSQTDKEPSTDLDLTKFEDTRILLIEDDEISRLVIKRFLKPLKVELEEEEDGKKGFELLMTRPFDLALVDINVPSMKGFEISKKARKQGIKIPIFAVTASEPDEIEDDARNNGMNGLLIKPFSKEELYQIFQTYFT